MQWNALDLTGLCSSSSAHRRFQEWEHVGVLAEIWRQALTFSCTVKIAPALMSVVLPMTKH